MHTDLNQGRSQEFKFGGAGAHGERGARAYNGGLGAEPPAGSRGRVPGGGSGGRSPPEAESLLHFRCRKEAAKCFIWRILETHKNARINDVLIRWYGMVY